MTNKSFFSRFKIKYLRLIGFLDFVVVVCVLCIKKFKQKELEFTSKCGFVSIKLEIGSKVLFKLKKPLEKV